MIKTTELEKLTALPIMRKHFQQAEQARQFHNERKKKEDGSPVSGNVEAHVAALKSAWLRSILAEIEVAPTHHVEAPAKKAAPAESVVIPYTNHDGKFALRRIEPRRIFFGTNEWHPAPTWLIEAFDLDKQEARTFAVDRIGSIDAFADMADRFASAHGGAGCAMFADWLRAFPLLRSAHDAG